MLTTSRGHTKIYWQFVKDAAASVRVYYPAGGLYQPVGKEGIAHVVDHVLATPNALIDGKYPGKYLLSVDAQTNQSYITFSGDSIEPTHFNKLIELIAKKIHDTPISRDAITSEAIAVRRELSNLGCKYPEMNQVFLHNYLSMNDSFTTDFGLVEGDIKTLTDRISVQDAMEYRDKHLCTPKAILIVGGMRPTKERIEYLEQLLCRTHTEPAEPKRLRQRLPEKGVEIFDTSRHSDGSNVYIGLGWVSELTTKKRFVEWQLFTNALSDPSLGLYNLLREKERLVYDFQGDQEIVAGKYQIFSLHTSTDRDNKERVKQLVMEYLQNEAALKEDIERSLREDKAELDSINDGSNSTMDWQSYLIQADVSLDEYKKYVNGATVDTIYNHWIKAFDPHKMTVVYS